MSKFYRFRRALGSAALVFMVFVTILLIAASLEPTPAAQVDAVVDSYAEIGSSWWGVVGYLGVMVWLVSTFAHAGCLAWTGRPWRFLASIAILAFVVMVWSKLAQPGLPQGRSDSAGVSTTVAAWYFLFALLVQLTDLLLPPKPRGYGFSP